MDDKLLGPLVTGACSLLVAVIGYATARRREGGAKRRADGDAWGALERRLWAGVVIVMLALVVGEAVAPLFHDTIVFPPQAYPFLVSGLAFWLVLSISGRSGGGNGGNGKGQP